MSAAIACTKVQYSARCVAETALTVLLWPGVRRFDPDHRPGLELQVYECRACGFYHLGHGRRRGSYDV